MSLPSCSGGSRGRPKLNWADRALLAALLGVIPKARRQGLRLLVTPDTIVCVSPLIDGQRSQVPPDRAGAPGDEDPHGSLPPPVRLPGSG